MNANIERTRKCVQHYRSIGLCPLPSRQDVKGPMLPTYAEHYGPTPVPESVYAGWWTTNIQVITGTRSPTDRKIIVVDCDGDEALEVWKSMCLKHKFDWRGIWIARTGGGGHHFYFSISPSETACPSGIIWGIWDTWGDNGKGRWIKHKEVRILADNALVIAPPSIHVETGERYAFDPRANPNVIPFPAEAPGWLLGMPRLFTPRFHVEAPKPSPTAPRRPPSGNYYTREEVIAAVGDRKLAEAKAWGLVTKSDQANHNGWVTCWVPGREDPRHSTPSGSFHFRDGTFQDRKDNTSISIFDLGASIGPYSTWQECRDDLGDRYIGTRCAKSTYEYVFQ